MMADAFILRLKNLVVAYGTSRGRKIQAVSGVSLDLFKGETLGLVGESGCGKSSLARAAILLPRPTSGNVIFRGEDLTRVNGGRLRKLRPKLQMIFQDSISALNPRRRVGDTVAMPLTISRKGRARERKPLARDMLASVGIDPDADHLLPFQFSGGQCQRIQIARALIAEPELLICDEPVSSLDVSIQAQIVNLLEAMRSRYGLTMLFISHDMALVKNTCDRIAVMYLGKLCEIAPAEDLFNNPAHPYTAVLISAIPTHGAIRSIEKVRAKSAVIPSPVNPPPGCRFHTRCPGARPICSESEPAMTGIGNHRQVACHFPFQAF